MHVLIKHVVHVSAFIAEGLGLVLKEIVTLSM